MRISESIKKGFWTVCLCLIPGHIWTNVPSGMPVQGQISSGFGARRSPFSGQTEFHRGVDIAARQGAKVMAPATGKVTQAGWRAVCGRSVSLRHRGGFVTRFCHLSRVRVAVGSIVRRGQIIGNVGSTGRSTGPHLHYSIKGPDGRFLDPRPFLQTGFKSQSSRKKVHRVSWTGACDRPVKIPAEYAALLEEATDHNGTNWLDYVTRSVDRIDFIPTRKFPSNGRSALGLASVVRGCRRAKVATRDRTPKDIARTLVHEAAHLAPFQQTRRLAEEVTARKVGARFLTDLRNARARKARRNTRQFWPVGRRISRDVSVSNRPLYP